MTLPQPGSGLISTAPDTTEGCVNTGILAIPWGQVRLWGSCCSWGHTDLSCLYCHKVPWWHLGTGCCWGSCLGLWHYPSQGLCWCPRLLIPSRQRWYQGSGSPLGPCWYLRVTLSQSEGHAYLYGLCCHLGPEWCLSPGCCRDQVWVHSPTTAEVCVDVHGPSCH